MNIIKKSKILKNFAYLTTGNLLAKLIGFIATIIVAKAVSVNDYGIYKWYSVIIGYLTLIINFGFDVYFYKLIFNKAFSLEKVLALQLKSRVIFGSIIYICAVLIIILFVHNFKYKILFLILLLQFVFYIFDTEILIKIKEEFAFLSSLIITKSLLNLLLVFCFVKKENDIINFAIIVSFVNFMGILICWFFLRYKFKLNFNKLANCLRKLNLSYIFSHLKESVIINLSFIMISIYYNLDSLMLGIFKTQSDVAIYSVAYSFILVAIMPTGMLYSVFSPKLSKSAYGKKVFFEYVFFTTALGGIIFVFLLLTYKYLIMYTYGEKYIFSIKPLHYLSFNIIPCYLAGAFANPINLWGDYKNYLFIVSSGALGNFVGNLILIPKLGINGAIFTTILSEVLVFLLALRYWFKNKEVLK